MKKVNLHVSTHATFKTFMRVYHCQVTILSRISPIGIIQVQLSGLLA